MFLIKKELVYRLMKKDNDRGNFIKKIWSGRAAQIFAVTATVFLCFLTVFEYMALRMEWDIPIFQVITGDSDSYVFQEYRNEEMALDQSTENILLEDDRKEASEQEVQGSEITGSSQSAESMEGTEVMETAESGEVIESIETAESSDLMEPGESMDSNEVTEASQTSEGIENTEASQQAESNEATEAAEEEELPYYIKVNRQMNCVTIYVKDENGEYTIPYKAMVCSTGLYNGTPRGTYHLSTKYLWRELYGGVYGQYATRITGGVLFHSVPYYRRSKSALCTEKYNKLGQQASMGCIRLTVEDAKWIAENCPSGTAVEIYDDKENPGPLGKPEAIKIDTDNPNKGWDPTDPDIENPWHELSEDE